MYEFMYLSDFYYLLAHFNNLPYGLKRTHCLFDNNMPAQIDNDNVQLSNKWLITLNKPIREMQLCSALHSFVFVVFLDFYSFCTFPSCHMEWKELGINKNQMKCLIKKTTQARRNTWDTICFNKITYDRWTTQNSRVSYWNTE